MTAVTRRFLIFAAVMAWCAALLIARVWRSGTLAYTFLVWNLFLAFLPAIFAILFARATKQASVLPLRILWFVLWLLFLPNAPYIATDFVHLAPLPRVPLWFDIALLLSFAGTGLLLGYSSGLAVTLIYGAGLALGYVAYQLPRLRMNMQSP